MTRPVRPSRLTLCLLLLVAARDDSCAISVGPNGLCARFRFDPQAATLQSGETLRITVHPADCVGACICGPDSVTVGGWRSDAPVVASVDSTGLVQGLRPGQALITGTVEVGADAVKGSTRVTVLP